jgi:hypothetical protein
MTSRENYILVEEHLTNFVSQSNKMFGFQIVCIFLAEKDCYNDRNDHD